MIDCKQFRERTGALLEGECLPEASAHLSVCPRCRLLVDELGAVERAARALPTYQPSPRLWARLEAAARQHGLWAQPPWWERFGSEWSFLPARPAFAALFAVTLLVAGGLVGYPSLELPVAQSAQASVFEVAQGELVREASYGTRYQVHLQQVEDRVLEEDAAPLDPALRQMATHPLNTLDRCIEQTQLRLTEYPDDSLAREELHRLYRQKATVLQAMSDPVWLDTNY